MTALCASVIVCTQDRAETLRGLLHQLRGQSFPGDAFEIIVVDNGSADHTREVVEELASTPGVHMAYVWEGRRGITFARNRGAEIARHPYLAYVDDDCSVGQNWLANLLLGFDLEDDVVAVGGRVELGWGQQAKPAWMSRKLERWLGANEYLGNKPCILKDGERVIECNMALRRESWAASRGFLGMEQFGSRHMAASEIVYLLAQLVRQGGKAAYMPSALATHHVRARDMKWMLQRAYWQGASDAILEELVHRGSLVSNLPRVAMNMAALLALVGITVVSYLRSQRGDGMFNLTRAIRRIGLVLGELRLVGDHNAARVWLSNQTSAHSQ